MTLMTEEKEGPAHRKEQVPGNVCESISRDGEESKGVKNIIILKRTRHKKMKVSRFKPSHTSPEYTIHTHHLDTSSPEHTTWTQYLIT